MNRLPAPFFAALFATLFATFAAFAAQAAPLQAGRDYMIIDPPLAATPGKVDVVEFFSYGCPHCKDFNPLVTQWESKAAPDVAFRKVPISFGRPAWARLSTVYYALEGSGYLKKLDNEVFTAVHSERNTFPNDDAIADWAASKGADRNKVLNAAQAFSMNSLIRQGDELAKAAKITGVPAVIVGGKYLITNPSSYDDMLRMVNELVAKVRTENAGKK